MIFDNLGLPKENGASDLQDSSRLAGVMTVFNFVSIIPLEKYLISEDGKIKYCRHPLERRYSFSRHQTLCLVAGLFFQGKEYLVDLKCVDGWDLFSPAHRGHIKRCQGGVATKFQDAWFWFDVFRSVHLDKLGEPNQLLCQMMVADKKFLKYWLKHNKKWRQSIENYWSGWRGEPELANHMIKKLEGYL